MKLAALFLCVSLIARNTLYSPALLDIPRAIALLLVAFFGIYGLLTSRSVLRLGRYWAQFGYIVSVLISIIGAVEVGYVAFQAISISVVILFSISYYERSAPENINSSLFTATFWCYVAILFISLLLLIVSPSLVYETLYGGELRFRGILPKSGMIGASAGVLIGIGCFHKLPLLMRLLAFGVGFPCLIITQSRTFMVAFLVAVVVTVFIYYRKLRKLIYIGLFLLVSMVVSINSLDINVRSVSIEKFMRIETISNLTGRVSIWENAFEAFKKNPWLGVGITAGAAALNKDQSSIMLNDKDDLNVGRNIGSTTMHNGYIQSLLDVGVVGTFFYCAIVLQAIAKLYLNDSYRNLSLEFFILIFLSISNLAENVIYAVTVYNSVLFMMVATFSASKNYVTNKARASLLMSNSKISIPT
ncbi:O-antigen ligase [Methylococcus sp. EFPC2]|uniref:O-antigen ligase family protein n=1 Tax=Methylococcus sp. EFPC2 TaxID=2812648 RepID=UPI0019681DCB|nr:O-antigen ligase family protein [Methylococcus sp. EFPC2]QSA98933.1 O-antigen ligase family protein [Methylococcus sp. EFPC2]